MAAAERRFRKETVREDNRHSQSHREGKVKGRGSGLGGGGKGPLALSLRGRRCAVLRARLTGLEGGVGVPQEV